MHGHFFAAVREFDFLMPKRDGGAEGGEWVADRCPVVEVSHDAPEATALAVLA